MRIQLRTLGRTRSALLAALVLAIAICSAPRGRAASPLAGRETATPSAAPSEAPLAGSIPAPAGSTAPEPPASAPEPARAGPRSRALAASDAITELEVDRARTLLDEVDADSATLAFERARLAIYVGDCDSAAAILSAPSLGASKDGAMLAALARSCARAVAGAPVVDDTARGVWVRVQDSADLPFVPFVAAVAARARDALARDLGVELPRPLRIELVRDLFSLSAVSGLPLSAAETTGTVGVARWGRVILVTPRATPSGYPWEDTLAHEITHLVVTRASRDRAPLWLQEGIAKRHETRWRTERPFDRQVDYHQVARDALVSGRSIGIDRIGASIAMLPTPEAAATAYAEVASFTDYFIAARGPAALRLLLSDMRGIGQTDPDPALRSVTGFELQHWNVIWTRHLLSLPGTDMTAKQGAHATGPNPVRGSAPPLAELARTVRLSDLLAQRGHYSEAARQVAIARAARPREAAIRWRAARAALGAGEESSARDEIGELEDISSLHGGWAGLKARLAEDPKAAASYRELGLSIDPWSEDAACGGHFRRHPTASQGFLSAEEPADPLMRALCRAAREIPSD